MLAVTVDMFSGRPNPTLTLEGEEAESVLRDVAHSGPTIAGVNEGFQGLGYRGLVVEMLADDLAERHGLPAAFRVGHDGHPKGLELAERIFSSMRRAQILDEGLHGLLAAELRQAGFRGTVTEADHSAPPAAEIAKALPPHELPVLRAVTCWIELGRFNPGFWNDPAYINRNNCYNYASNRRTNTFAQPGRATGHQATVMACPNVTAGALSDGLHHRFDCFPDSEKPRWLMALVVAPGYDYHWYRKQLEGFWGHKPGGTAARNVDNNGAVIWNPETAARGPYTNFCGYFYACKSQKIN
jgi:hypothetical protein